MNLAHSNLSLFLWDKNVVWPNMLLSIFQTNAFVNFSPPGDVRSFPIDETIFQATNFSRHVQFYELFCRIFKMCLKKLAGFQFKLMIGFCANVIPC